MSTAASAKIHSKHEHPETEIYRRDRKSRKRGGGNKKRKRRRRKGIKVKRDLLVVQLILIQSRWGEGGE